MTVAELLELHELFSEKSLSKEEVLLFYGTIRAARAQTVLECGTFNGMSAMWAATALEENGAEGKVHTFDTVARDHLFVGTGDTEKRIEFTEGEFERCVGEVIARGVPHPWVVFIDGWKGYDAAKAYWEAVEPHLETGDFVLWHDTTTRADQLHARGLQAVEQGAISFLGTYGIAIYRHGDYLFNGRSVSRLP